MCPHSNATTISSDYRLIKIELCTIAMMNMEMGFRPMMCDYWSTRMFGRWKSCQKPIIANQAWLRRGWFIASWMLLKLVLVTPSNRRRSNPGRAPCRYAGFCCELDLSQAGRELKVVFCEDLFPRGSCGWRPWLVTTQQIQGGRGDVMV